MIRNLLPVAVALTLTLSLTGCSREPAAAPRPLNVLLVTLDTTRADRFGCYGATPSRTPHFDALAADGAVFLNAMSQAAVTPVAHAGILTGLYPFQHGVRVLYAGSGYRLPENAPTLATILRPLGWTTAAILSAYPVSERFGFDHGMDFFDNGCGGDAGEMIKGPDGKYQWDVRTSQRRSDATTEAAIEWLRSTPGRFMLWVHYWDPHDGVRTPPPEFLAPYLRDRVSPQEAMLGLYEAEVAYVDEQFGRLVAFLKEQKRYDDTIIVVVSDHGEGLGDHGWWYHRILYQEQIHVPLLMRIPGEAPGKRVAELAPTVDILPTLLEALSIKPAGGLAGRSLLGPMRGQQRPPAVAYADQLNLYDLNANMVSKRPQDDLVHCASDGRWKLIHRPRQPDRDELFDLAQDPKELNNLYRPDHPEAVRLLAALDAFGGYRDEPFEEGADAEALERLRSLGYVGGAYDSESQPAPD